MMIPMTGAIAASSGPKKKRIRVLYSLHAEVQPGPDWPNVGFNFAPVMQQMTAALAAEGRLALEARPAGADRRAGAALVTLFEWRLWPVMGLVTAGSVTGSMLSWGVGRALARSGRRGVIAFSPSQRRHSASSACTSQPGAAVRALS